MATTGRGQNFGGFNKDTKALFIARPGAGARLARDQKGRYANLSTQAKYAHELMARDAAKSIQQELRDRVADNGREQNVGRGRNSHLIRAINQPKNRVASADGFAVMLYDYMNSSKAAPYWRNLESGSRVHVGRELRGFFLSRSGKAFPPLRNEKFHTHGRLIQTNKIFARTKESKANIVKRDGSFDLRFGITKKPLKDPDGTGFKIIIRRPIPAYHYISQGAAEFIEATAFDRYYQQAFKDVPYVPTGKKPKVSRV